MQNKLDDIDHITNRMQIINHQIDLVIQNYKPTSIETSRLPELEDKLKSLEDDRKQLSAQIIQIHDYQTKLSIFDQAIDLSDHITTAIAQSSVRKQQNEAKAFLLTVIKDEKRDIHSVIDLKKQMIEIYTQIDNLAADIDKINGELLGIKKDLFTALNSKMEVLPQELENKRSLIQNKIAAHEHAKVVINENLSLLRKISVEDGKQQA
jgi:hypothetical protein